MIPRPPPQQERDYRDPRTGLGVALAGAGASAGTGFLLHECGCLAYRDWNHRAILSPYWRLHYNFGPGNSIQSGAHHFALDAEHAILTPAGVTIDTFGPKSPLHTWIHFSPTSSFQIALREPLSLPLTAPLHATFQALAALFDASGQPLPHIPLPRPHHLCQSLLHLVFSELDPASFQSYPPSLHALLLHLENHPADDLSNERLARHSGMSLARFAPWFKSHVGLTPARYVQKLRVRLAASQLCFSQASIEDIASSTGFANRFHFSRVFRVETGCSPAAYRKAEVGRKNDEPRPLTA